MILEYLRLAFATVLVLAPGFLVARIDGFSSGPTFASTPM